MTAWLLGKHVRVTSTPQRPNGRPEVDPRGSPRITVGILDVVALAPDGAVVLVVRDAIGVMHIHQIVQPYGCAGVRDPDIVTVEMI